MDFAGKRLLILGGSRISCEIVRHARAMGITTAVDDWYPWEKSPAKQVADEAYYVSTADVDAMANLIKTEHFDGVITGFTDSVLPYYAQICEKAGLPAYGTKEQFELFTDKAKYKQLMREFDVPTIPEYRIDLDCFEQEVTRVTFPVIVKPTDSSGSRGITVCYNPEELKEAMGIALGESKTRVALVERYVEAPEATVFWLFVDGQYYVSLLGNRHIKHNQEGVLPLPVGYTYPSWVQPRFLQEVAPRMERMFSSVGIRNGMMFMQCKVVDGTCLVYDIGYRLTGSLEYINQRSLCGYDPLDMLICFALTGKMNDQMDMPLIDPYLEGKYAYNVSVLCRPGKIALIEGVDEVRQLPGVIDVVVAHPVGDVITEAMRGRLAQITVRILGRAETKSQMLQEMLEVQHLIHVQSDTGKDLVLPGLDSSDFEGACV